MEGLGCFHATCLTCSIFSYNLEYERQDFQTADNDR